MIIISEQQRENFNAGPKAPRDVSYVLTEKKETECFNFPVTINDKKLSKIKNIIMKDIFLRKIKRNNEYYLIQMPFSRSLYFEKFVSRNKTILFIHDLVGLRYDNKLKEKREINIYKKCNYIVAHNNKMKQYLMSRGVDKNKIFVLELFDYICNVGNHNVNTLSEIPQIVYAGNLSKYKSPFIYLIDENKINFNLNLYGVGIEHSLNKKIKYCGSYLPEELPNHLTGDLGLVWDGDISDDDEDSGFKRYTKYNNPHKLSCYIAAGLPVIVWEKSAIADFVLKNNIGYTISNIYEINELDFSDYHDKKVNVDKISKKVKQGFYTNNVINKIKEKIKSENGL